MPTVSLDIRNNFISSMTAVARGMQSSNDPITKNAGVEIENMFRQDSFLGAKTASDIKKGSNYTINRITTLLDIPKELYEDLKKSESLQKRIEYKDKLAGIIISAISKANISMVASTEKLQRRRD